MNTKSKTIKRHIVQLSDGRFCRLDRSFHPLGVCVPCDINPEAKCVHLFGTLNGANHAIARTLGTQKEIERGMYPGWKAFDPLKFSGVLAPTEIQVDNPDYSEPV